nr:glycosyltransferase family 2 protein [uncultured Shinella sp.]
MTMETDKARISAIIITKNEASLIGACLASLAFCDEIIVVDSLSEDETQSIAAAAGARVLERPFAGFGAQKEFARQQASHEWVLSLDADERIPPELAAEIMETLARPGFDAYRIPRLSSFLGRPFRHSGWWPDEPLRLFRADRARFNEKLVHEFLETDAEIGTLRHAMTHDSVRSIDQALEKSRHYSTLGARQLAAANRKPTVLSAVVHGVGAFFKTYILKRGFLDGQEGLINAVLHSNTIFWKYAKGWELTRR